MPQVYAYWASSLIGGAEGSLDSINTTSLEDTAMAIANVPGDKCYFYIFDDDSVLAESSPDVVEPDTGNGRWILQSVHVKIDGIDLDGGTDIGAALTDTDLILVDDGAGGTNRKCAMSRVKTFTAWDGDIADIDLDGGVDIGAALVDADLILVDDGAGGTNRKCTMDRVKDYVITGLSIVYFASVIPTMMTAEKSDIDISHETLIPTMMTTTVSDE